MQNSKEGKRGNERKRKIEEYRGKGRKRGGRKEKRGGKVVLNYRGRM